MSSRRQLPQVGRDNDDTRGMSGCQKLTAPTVQRRAERTTVPSRPSRLPWSGGIVGAPLVVCCARENEAPVLHWSTPSRILDRVRHQGGMLRGSIGPRGSVIGRQVGWPLSLWRSMACWRSLGIPGQYRRFRLLPVGALRPQSAKDRQFSPQTYGLVRFPGMLPEFPLMRARTQCLI